MRSRSSGHEESYIVKPPLATSAMSRAYVCPFIATIRSYVRARATCPSLLTRISYHVGRPWMFDGNRFLPETGTPIRKIERIRRLFALEDPVPLTLASFRAKSFTFERGWEKCCAATSGCHRDRRRNRQRDEQLEFLHVPRRGRAALGAEPAVDAEILVLDHDAPRLRQRRRHVERLIQVPRRGGQSGAEVGLVAVLGDGQALHRANVDACVALDAQRRREHSLDIAVEAALHLSRGLLSREPDLHLGADALKPSRQLDVLHALAGRRVVIVVVAPLGEAHLLAHQVDPLWRARCDRDALAVVVNRDRCLVPVLHRPDDVLRPHRGVAAEEDAGQRRLKRDRVYHRHVPLAELESEIALDPGKRILLADRKDDVVARDHYRVDDGRVARLLIPFEALKLHAHEHAVIDDKSRRSMVDDDLDTLLLGVLQLPRRGFEVRPRAARHDRDVAAIEAQRRSAAVHRRIADSDDQHSLADLLGVAERDRLQPVDADMDAIALAPSGDIEVLAAWCPGADEDRIEVLLEQGSEARHRRVQSEVDPQVDDGGDLLVEDLRGEPEGRDIGAHQAARLVELLEDDHLVAEWDQVVCHGERRRPRTDADDPPPGLARGNHGEAVGDVAAQVGGDPFQAADRHRGPVDPGAPARGLAGAVAGSPEDP